MAPSSRAIVILGLTLLFLVVVLLTGCGAHTRELRATAANDLNSSADRIVEI